MKTDYNEDCIVYTVQDAINKDHPSNYLLMAAIKMKNLDAVRLICKFWIPKKININVIHENGETALSYSLLPENHKTEIIECLLHHGADPNINPKNDYNIIRAFDNTNSLEAFWLLITYGADINKPNIPNPLGISIIDGMLDVSFNLLNYDVDPNVPNQYGITALGNAACSKYTEMIHALIIHGADPLSKQGENENIIMLAAQCGSYNVLKTILMIITREYTEHIYSMLHHVDDNGKTSLIHAIESGSYRKVNSILRYGANVNQCCSDGHIPLYYAIAYGNIKIVRALLRSNPKITREQMNTIIHYYRSPCLKPLIDECIRYFQRINEAYIIEKLDGIRIVLMEMNIPFDIAINISHKSIEDIYISEHIKDIDISRSVAIYHRRH